MVANTRAGQFLRHLTAQPKISVNVQGTGKDAKTVANGRFARALKTVIPAILASAATYALTTTPQTEMRVQDAPKCMYDYVLMREADNDEFEPGIMLMLGLAGASSEVNRGIESWSRETNRDPAQAVAAFCDNPEDWKGQLQKWDSAASNQDTKSPVLRMVANRAYTEFGARAKTVYAVANDVVNVRDMYGAQAIKVSGLSNQKFINAASSIANGMSSFFGRDTERSVRDMTSTARQGQQRLRQGENIIKRKDPYDQVRSIGDLMGGIGHDFQRHSQKAQAEERRREREYQNELRKYEQEQQRLRQLEQQAKRGDRYR